MNFYMPNRVIVTPSALTYPKTNEIISRLPTDVSIVYSENQMPKLPSGESEKYLNNTLLLCTRSKAAPFNEIFASPGNVTENIGTMGKIATHCPLGCEFCYLKVAGRSTPWTRIYVDLDGFREESKREIFVHTMSLTLWSSISFYTKKPLLKVPEGFKDVCDNKIRKAKLTSHKSSREFLSTYLRSFFVDMNIEIDESRFEIVLRNLPMYYRENKKIPLWINIGEYTDILGTDHITGNMNDILGWMEEDKELRVKFRTKAPYIKNILKHDNLDRLCVTFDLNTEFAINKYQTNVFSLRERIRAIKKLMSHGAKVKLAIEPIIFYQGYEKDYVKLFKKIERELDLSQMDDIKIGCVRYKTQLMNHIKRSSPDTDLFEAEYPLIPPVKGDKRWRYSQEDRVRIYSLILNSLEPKNRKLIQLGAEDPEVWKQLNLNPFVVHDESVYQHH